MDTAPARFFVYGTLMPGHLRWEMLAPVSVSSERAEVSGRLFDTGLGWPAAWLGGSGEVVPGWVVEVESSAVAAVLALLDEVEDGFERVRVRTTDGVEAWAYSVPLPTPVEWVPIRAWTSQVER